MPRMLITLSLIGLSTLAVSAVQAQSVPLAGNGVSTSTMNYSAMPQVARDPKGSISTWTPSAEESFVKEEIRGAGYSGVSDLERDSDGTWHARAYKGPADVLVAVDHAGHITEAHQ